MPVELQKIPETDIFLDQKENVAGSDSSRSPSKDKPALPDDSNSTDSEVETLPVGRGHSKGPKVLSSVTWVGKVILKNFNEQVDNSSVSDKSTDPEDKIIASDAINEMRSQSPAVICPSNSPPGGLSPGRQNADVNPLTVESPESSPSHSDELRFHAIKTPPATKTKDEDAYEDDLDQSASVPTSLRSDNHCKDSEEAQVSEQENDVAQTKDTKEIADSDSEESPSFSPISEHEAPGTSFALDNRSDPVPNVPLPTTTTEPILGLKEWELMVVVMGRSVSSVQRHPLACDSTTPAKISVRRQRGEHFQRMERSRVTLNRNHSSAMSPDGQRRLEINQLSNPLVNSTEAMRRMLNDSQEFVVKDLLDRALNSDGKIIWLVTWAGWTGST
ncbi:uncharacterized protein LOC107046577 isoform X2 [Diachasma alloeum]|nr:uncharacterized protein LOC107046577 isoform X2 [Diachasma alloeum]